MIYVVGSVNLDYVARLQALPRPGETVLGSPLTKTPGGKGANQALAARRAGADVRLIACIGSDDDGAAAVELLEDEGVDLSGLVESDLPTGVAMIQIDAAGENAIAVLPGANSALSVEAVRKGLARLTQGDVVVLQQEIAQPATRAAIHAARQAGAISIVNVAPVLPDSAELAVSADVVIANESEFQAIARRASGVDAAQEWCRATGRRLALTLGAQGAIFAGPDDALHVPAPKIEPLDTVGAGDTFAGYLSAALHAGQPAPEALDLAVRASALACLSAGAQSAMPTMDRVACFGLNFTEGLG